jgi:hypothetical protein
MPRDRPSATVVRQIVYRYSSYDTPFWARENSRPGRWHGRGDGPTQYMSLSSDGAWAELIRREELRSEDEVAMVSVSMWAIDLNQAMIVDYSTFDCAEASGFDPEALVEEDYERCQREARRLRGLKFAGILAPSAALPGALNVTLFGPRVASTWGKPPVLASSIPAGIITKGAPPPGLLARVRRIGLAHEGLEFHHAAVRRAAADREGAGDS